MTDPWPTVDPAWVPHPDIPAPTLAEIVVWHDAGGWGGSITWPQAPTWGVTSFTRLPSLAAVADALHGALLAILEPPP